MTHADKIDTTDIKQLANGEFVDYADSDVVIIDDLRNFSKLQTVRVDFLLIIVVTSGRVALTSACSVSTLQPRLCVFRHR